MTSVLDRVLSKIEVDGIGCWMWTASIRQGYGQIRVGRSTRQAHRVLYELLVAEVPDDLDLDHLCRRRRCCNPDHLEPVTRRVNLHRSPTSNATLGRLGRPVPPANVKLSPGDRVEIRARLAAGETKRAIAERFGVTSMCVHHLATGRSWRQDAA